MASSHSAPAVIDVTTSGYHLLAVDGYSSIKEGTPNGMRVDSCPFTVAGYRWRIKFYPNGYDPENAANISFSLSLDEGDIIAEEPLKVQYLFSFIDQVEKHASSHVLAREAQEFSSKDHSWAIIRGMNRKAFEPSKHLKGDSFTTRCDIVVTKNGNGGGSHAAGASPAYVAVPPPEIQHHLLSLLRSGKGTDVTFDVGGETIAAHRCVLAARSCVFAAELFGPMKEGTTTSGVICIQDMEARVFRLLLDFIYSDSVPGMEEAEGGRDVIWQQMFVAADRYGLDRLRLMCEEKLSGCMNASTVATILALAEQHQCRGLKEACFNFLRSQANMQQVMANGGLDLLTKTCPSVLKELIAKLFG